MTQSLSGSDLKAIRVFVTIVENGGFSAAQASLNLGQSAVSAYIADLETRLGLTLCRRGRAGFSLTEDGQQIYESAKRLLGAITDFEASATSAGKGLVGELRLAVVDAVIDSRDWDLSRAIDLFLDQSPHLRINLSIVSPGEIERRLLDGRVHLGIGVFYRKLKTLQYRDFAPETQGLFCGAGHLLATMEPAEIKIPNVLAMDYIGLSYIPKAAARYRRWQFRTYTTAETMEAVAILLLANRFVGHLPVHFAHPWVKSGRMREILPDVFGSMSTFSMVQRPDGPSPRLVSSFMQILSRTQNSGRKKRK
jgi:LysR family transcriptional regulator, transcriptional activator for bauABCD operon